MTHTGHCFCGQVSFTIDAEPVGARMCWCRDCQRVASGSPTVSVLFPEDAPHFSGNVTTMTKIGDSGNTVERGFCGLCGSQLYSRTLSATGERFMRIRAGVLDDNELCPPERITWVSSAPSWAPLDPALPWHTKGPGSPLVDKE